MSDGPGFVRNMCVSGIIATIVALACTWAASLVWPFPWGAGQAMSSTAIACFCGAAVSYWQGNRRSG
jgi:hypothetical protein